MVKNLDNTRAALGRLPRVQRFQIAQVAFREAFRGLLRPAVIVVGVGAVIGGIAWALSRRDSASPFHTTAHARAEAPPQVIESVRPPSPPNGPRLVQPDSRHLNTTPPRPAPTQRHTIAAAPVTSSRPVVTIEPQPEPVEVRPPVRLEVRLPEPPAAPIESALARVTRGMRENPAAISGVLGIVNGVTTGSFRAETCRAQRVGQHALQQSLLGLYERDTTAAEEAGLRGAIARLRNDCEQ